MRPTLFCVALVGCSSEARYDANDFSLACGSGLAVRHSEHFETERWDFVRGDSVVMRIVEFADTGANRSLDGIHPDGALPVDGARCDVFPLNERNLLAKCRLEASRSYAVFVENANERTKIAKCLRTLHFKTDER